MARPAAVAAHPAAHRRGRRRAGRRGGAGRALGPPARRPSWGVQGPSLYNHFATKAEIVDAVADAVVARVDVSAFGTYPLA